MTPVPADGPGEPAETRRLSRGSVLIAVVLGLLVAAFHYGHGAPLARTMLMASFNWLFDFDSSRFIGAWCTPGAAVSRDLDIAFVARHVLSLPTRALCLPLTALAGSPGAGLMALTALCAGCAAAVAYGLAAAFCEREFDRLLLAVGYAVSVHPLMLGLIPETYGFALLGLGVHLMLLGWHRPDGLGAGVGAAFSLFLDLGVTVTNAALNVVSGVVMSWGRKPLRSIFRTQARVWLLGGGALLLVTLVSAAVFAPGLLGLAGSAPKAVWWIVNINRGEPASLLMVLCTFFLYSFVAPAFTVIDLPAPDGHPMLDFRAFHFNAVGGVALALWAVAFVLSVALAWRERGFRRLLIVVAIWMLINVILHWYWQYRGSIYLYGAHTSFALFAVLVMGYGAALRRYRGALVRGYGVLLLVLAAVNNYDLYQGMVDFLLRHPLTS